MNPGVFPQSLLAVSSLFPRPFPASPLRWSCVIPLGRRRKYAGYTQGERRGDAGGTQESGEFIQRCMVQVAPVLYRKNFTLGRVEAGFRADWRTSRHLKVFVGRTFTHPKALVWICEKDMPLACPYITLVIPPSK
jgi:hypothetical protein